MNIYGIPFAYYIRTRRLLNSALDRRDLRKPNTPHFESEFKMKKPTSTLLVIKGILGVGLIGLGLFFLSTLEGLPGIVLGFAFLYLAFFISAVIHTGVQPANRLNQ